jgi:hypothetical protein
MDTFLAETVDLLERTPNVVRALLGGLPDAWAGTADVEGGWRPRDVVGHLVTAELDNWIPRVKRILDDGTSKPFDPFNRFAHEGRDDAMSLDQLIDRFGALRAQNLRQLADIVTEADLDRRGIHPVLGEVTLRQLLSTWTVHDLDHIAQIYAGMAGSRDTDVGPWKTNLGILLRRDDPSAVPS